MAYQPAPKRRRLHAPEEHNLGPVVPVTLIRRRDDDIRTSLQDLHGTLDEHGDVIVHVQGEHGTSEEFPCVASLLASASRPLGAMLFGPMRAVTPQSGDARPRLALRLTEPEHFRNLLRYIHGQDLPLEIDEAFQLHEIADFYEVLGLRDACCRFLLDSLRPHNCCHLLSRAHEVHCELLVQRCIDLLVLDFIAVVDHDPEFAALNASAIVSVLARDELVCADEFEVFEAIVHWYSRAPSDEKYAALLEMLALVRWPLVSPERHGALLELASKLRPPSSSHGADGADGGGDAGVADVIGAMDDDGGRKTPLAGHSAGRISSPSHDRSPVCVGDGASSPRAMSPCHGQRKGETGEAVAESEVLRFIREALSAADSTASGPLPPPRQCTWGLLASRSPPNQPAGGDGEKVYTLASTKEYMVGRSRKSDIRIGHNAPMPYISSQHFRIFHAIQWPEKPLESLVAALNPTDDAERQPRLQAWLEDLSQNGTFINGHLVGRNKQQPLSDGDRIEMVFPAGRHPPQPNANQFPTFTFTPHRPHLAAVEAADSHESNSNPPPNLLVDDPAANDAPEDGGEAEQDETNQVDLLP